MNAPSLEMPPTLSKRKSRRIASHSRTQRAQRTVMKQASHRNHFKKRLFTTDDTDRKFPSNPLSAVFSLRPWREDFFVFFQTQNHF
jgi:hypothetical protein